MANVWCFEKEKGMSTKMGAYCAEQPATQLVIQEEDDLDGLGIGWPEPLELIQDHAVEKAEDGRYVVEDYCSKTCIHLAGEMKHSLTKND
jgi:hypothetical protein